MSKKHFIALADAVKNGTALTTLTQVQIEALANGIRPYGPGEELYELRKHARQFTAFEIQEGI